MIDSNHKQKVKTTKHQKRKLYKWIGFNNKKYVNIFVSLKNSYITLLHFSHKKKLITTLPLLFTLNIQ